MQYSSSSPFQLTLSLLCIHLLCRQNIFMTMSCSREYFIRDQERRKQVYTVDKENFESNWKNFLCLSFLSCPPFKFQRQKKKKNQGKKWYSTQLLKTVTHHAYSKTKTPSSWIKMYLEESKGHVTKKATKNGYHMAIFMPVFVSLEPKEGGQSPCNWWVLNLYALTWCTRDSLRLKKVVSFYDSKV